MEARLLSRPFHLRERWRRWTWIRRGAPDRQRRQPLRPPDTDRLRAQIRECLDGRGGEVSARARAAQLGHFYLRVSPPGRRTFLRLLATEFDVDRAEVDAAARRLLKAPDAEHAGARRALHAALEPPRLRLLTQFSALPEGIKFLVDLRADALRFARRDPAIRAVADDLRALLSRWFDVGFLELRRVTWDSPASLLEKLARYEAVHAVSSWIDLKNRLDADRRLIAFFHPQMPDEPLVFVEVALVRGLAAEVGPLLDERAPLGDPDRADTAIFYSISNTQRGLAGMRFGGFLIKQVVDALSAELPNLKTFATLSPVPGFREWLERDDAEAGRDEPIEVVRSDDGSAPVSVVELLRGDGWPDDPSVEEALRRPLLRACARYLLHAKDSDGRALDPVAHFHLSNGARVERLNWLADRSEAGIAHSAGIMVNYVYELKAIEANHEAYTGDATVAASPTVSKLTE